VFQFHEERGYVPDRRVFLDGRASPAAFDHIHYGSAKAGLLGFVRALARDGGQSRDHGQRGVPGAVDTGPFNAGLFRRAAGRIRRHAGLPDRSTEGDVSLRNPLISASRERATCRAPPPNGETVAKN